MIIHDLSVQGRELFRLFLREQQRHADARCVACHSASSTPSAVYDEAVELEVADVHQQSGLGDRGELRCNSLIRGLGMIETQPPLATQSSQIFDADTGFDFSHSPQIPFSLCNHTQDHQQDCQATPSRRLSHDL